MPTDQTMATNWTRDFLAWGPFAEFSGLWSLLWLVSARRAEVRPRHFDPDTLPAELGSSTPEREEPSR
jgi:hypothetical protein